MFDLLVRGHSNKEIGERLAISARTVEDHRAAIVGKTRTNGLNQLIALSRVEGGLTGAHPDISRIDPRGCIVDPTREFPKGKHPDPEATRGFFAKRSAFTLTGGSNPLPPALCNSGRASHASGRPLLS